MRDAQKRPATGPAQDIPPAEPVRIVVLGKPVPWSVKITQRGRTYKSGSLKDFHAQMRAEARAVMADRPVIDGPVAISVLAVLPVPDSWSQKKKALALSGCMQPCTKPDATNLLKSAEDACTSIIFADDKQVCRQTNVKIYGDKPRIEVVVEPITAVAK